MTDGTLIPRGGGESADVLGITVRFLVTKEMSGGAFSLFTNVAAPGMAIPMHTHRRDHETRSSSGAALSAVSARTPLTWGRVTRSICVPGSRTAGARTATTR
jgi:hypothetical protein